MKENNMPSHTSPSAWKRLKEKFNRVPAYVWTIVLLMANVGTCTILFQTCDSASGRGVNDKLFTPVEDEAEEEFIEANYEDNRPATVTIDTIAEPVFDEMIGANADILNSTDMTDPNAMFEEEKVNAQEYDGVEYDEPEEEILEFE